MKRIEAEAAWKVGKAKLDGRDGNKQTAIGPPHKKGQSKTGKQTYAENLPLSP
jgi:hypothetical protein